jgi:uncharacterized protein (DUF302 family)
MRTTGNLPVHGVVLGVGNDTDGHKEAAHAPISGSLHHTDRVQHTHSWCPMETTAYAFKTTSPLRFEDAIQRVTEELMNEGFGVLTEIDVQATLKKKLNVEFRKYRILGACNPPNAHKALTAEIDIGLMLPCNVVVYENEAGKTVVAAIDPMASMAAVRNSSLEDIAGTVRSKLQRVIQACERAAEKAA